MPDKFMKTRVLGTLDIDTDEAKKDIAQKINLAAKGAFPYVVREMMKKALGKFYRVILQVMLTKKLQNL